jgi:hypothetical protein
MIPYHVAAERAQRAMYQVEIVTDCPDCGEPVTCTVYGDDVELSVGCVNGCETSSHYDRDALFDKALGRAAGERSDYAAHLRDGGL